MNVEITLKRDEVKTLGWDKEFLRRFEAYLEANPQAGELTPDGFYRRFISAHRTLIAGMEMVLGDDAIEPFTITIKVEGKNKVYGPGPVNY